jgi:hypothetical protein
MLSIVVHIGRVKMAPPDLFRGLRYYPYGQSERRYLIEKIK